ncbi:uncharacterized protein K452DRAFT_256118, partial [Aplosporella prunicola CBS 121167]
MTTAMDASSTFVLTDIRLFTGENVIEHGYVYVVDGLIWALGAGAPPIYSSVAAVVPTRSLPGHTLLPGLIDAHIHAHRDIPDAIAQALRFGVTTVLDMHNEFPRVRQLKEIAARDLDVADYKAAGLAATIEGGWPEAIVTLKNRSEETLADISTWPKLNTPASAAAFVASHAAQGGDYVKLMHESGVALGLSVPQPTVELQRAVVDAAHKLGRVVVAHATSLSDTLAVLSTGIDGLTHTFCDQSPTPELVAAYQRTGAWLNPTLATMGTITGEGRELQERFANDPRVERLLDKGQKEKMCQCANMKAEGSRVEFAYESVRVLKEAGVDIICGSDAAGPLPGTAFGLSTHHELFLLVNKCGFTPQEALRSATSLTAKKFGFPDRGLIREGRKADLILVEGNPLDDIDATLNLKGVWRDGVLNSAYRGR